MEKPEHVRAYEKAIDHEANDVKTITMRFYMGHDKEGEYWCAFSDEYSHFGGQGRTQKEAMADWANQFNILLGDDKYKYNL